jgi:protein-S-isoprenylcysteine O-methyltransferase Ste14
LVAFKTLLFTILVPGTVTILIPGLLLGWGSVPAAFDIGALRWLGLLPFLAGAGFYLRCAWDFVVAGRGTPAPIDAPKHLVVRGLYHMVRNPMYVGVLLCVGGEALLFGSAGLLLYAALLFLCFHTFITLYEEPALRRLFGASYEQYCAAVPRWVPKI